MDKRIIYLTFLLITVILTLKLGKEAIHSIDEFPELETSYAFAAAEYDSCYVWVSYQEDAMVLQCATGNRGCCYIDDFYGETKGGRCIRIAYPDCSELN